MTADEYLKLAQLAHKQGDQATELKALKDWEANGGKARGIGTELGEGFKRFGEGIVKQLSTRRQESVVFLGIMAIRYSRRYRGAPSGGTRTRQYSGQYCQRCR